MRGIQSVGKVPNRIEFNGMKVDATMISVLFCLSFKQMFLCIVYCFIIFLPIYFLCSWLLFLCTEVFVLFGGLHVLSIKANATDFFSVRHSVLGMNGRIEVVISVIAQLYLVLSIQDYQFNRLCLVGYYK